jgi:prepilin-type N-terminal cleavage/methylation domain-containing protein
MKPDGSRNRRRAFTLVELITVVAILGILVTLMVGAVQGARNYVARRATIQMFAALDAALQRYFEDYNLYPYTQTVGDYGWVDASLRVTTGQLEDWEATLYKALNSKTRHGPYFQGSSALVISRIIGAGTTSPKTYYLFADGWGRKIYYRKPSDAIARRNMATADLPPTALNLPISAADSGADKGPPCLESQGADEFYGDDNIVNYGQISAPER